MNTLQFLTHEQVCELTGAKTKAGQVMVLKRNGIRHTIKHSGWPCVTTSALTGETAPSADKPKWQPRLAG